MDTLTRERPPVAVERSFTGERVAESLDQVAQQIGLPEGIQVDNGSEFTSKALDEWAAGNTVKLVFSRPGTPPDTPYIEAFNGRLRAECLDQHWFTSLEEARSSIAAWRVEYNSERPHTALNNQAPAIYRAAWERERQLAENGEHSAWTTKSVLSTAYQHSIRSGLNQPGSVGMRCVIYCGGATTSST